MKQLFQHGKLVLLTLVLAVMSLTVAATASPAAHAGCTPSISTDSFAQGTNIYGNCMNPNVQIRVELLTTDLRDDLATGYVYADNNGSFEAQLKTTYVGNVSVVADEICTSCTGDSFWTGAYIYPAPYLKTFGSFGFADGAEASGFTPGGLVDFYVYDSNWHLLGSKQVTVTLSGWNAGFADTYLNFFTSSTQIVHVIAEQVAPFTLYSNWVEGYV
jgi:hypothetical protein